MFLLPAIDLLDGKPVMLFQGKYDEVTSIGDNPVKMAQAIEKTGVEWLHMVDLDGAREKKVVNGDLIRKVIENTNLKIDPKIFAKNGRILRYVKIADNVPTIITVGRAWKAKTKVVLL